MKQPCSTPYCRRRVTKGNLCNTCRTRKWRKENPVRSAWINLRNNAKRRGVLFTITFEQFEQWCVKVKYIGFQGRNSDSYTIDRRHNDIGYHIDNIQVLKKRDNIVKYFHYDYRSKAIMMTEGVESGGGYF